MALISMLLFPPQYVDPDMLGLGDARGKGNALDEQAA